jgi:hypothetical protein
VDEPTGSSDHEAMFPPVPRVSADEGAAAYHAWERGTTSVASDHELFNLVIKRSVSDLRLLINEGPGRTSATCRLVSRGSLPCSAVTPSSRRSRRSPSGRRSPSRSCTSSRTTRRRRTTRHATPNRQDPPRAADRRDGTLRELPHTPYYGSVDSTPLWLILLGATFDWTGDRAMVDRLWPNALAALAWIDRYGDRDGDGFVEYERRTDRGC